MITDPNSTHARGRHTRFIVVWLLSSRDGSIYARQLADRARTTERSVYRAIAFLRANGFRIAASKGPGGGYLLR